MIRHITSLENTKGNKIIDPLKVKHCVITALKIYDLSGFIDPKTHLNLDLSEHLMKIVYVAKELKIGSEIILNNNTYKFVLVDQSFYKHYGPVDTEKLSEDLIKIYHKEMKK
ncbi:hypothetical protein [Acidiplasma cupricumulans]|uniref:Uncharacterized protein n=1 Tax=Acidiplasma cupricumulans TaxID=312540 RepID=A0A0Q0XJS0_9ARCH|nr:hypothetical protein [Acidiplasma cupricumulans]KQB35208.1 hypothetical protein AOG55_00610 [Acidiplasma cupricumulans]